MSESLLQQVDEYENIRLQSLLLACKMKWIVLPQSKHVLYVSTLGICEFVAIVTWLETQGKPHLTHSKAKFKPFKQQLTRRTWPFYNCTSIKWSSAARLYPKHQNP
eukprot:1242056-Amphidinium_carterae.1